MRRYSRARVSKAPTFLWCTLLHTLLPISAPEGTAYIGDRASTSSSFAMLFLTRETPYSNPCPEVFSPASVTVLFRNSSQMLNSDVPQIKQRYLLSSSFPNDHSLCIQRLKRLTVGLTARRPGFSHRSVQVRYVFTGVTMGLVRSQSFSTPCQHSTTNAITHIPFTNKPTLQVQ